MNVAGFHDRFTWDVSVMMAATLKQKDIPGVYGIFGSVLCYLPASFTDENQIMDLHDPVGVPASDMLIEVAGLDDSFFVPAE